MRPGVLADDPVGIELGPLLNFTIAFLVIGPKSPAAVRPHSGLEVDVPLMKCKSL
jgi:hypothetical protein